MWFFFFIYYFGSDLENWLKKIIIIYKILFIVFKIKCKLFSSFNKRTKSFPKSWKKGNQRKKTNKTGHLLPHRSNDRFFFFKVGPCVSSSPHQNNVKKKKQEWERVKDMNE